MTTPIVAKKQYKRIYVAKLTQTGTAAPVAKVLENTLGGDVTWVRVSTGLFEGTISPYIGNIDSLVPTIQDYSPLRQLKTEEKAGADNVVSIKQTGNIAPYAVGDDFTGTIQIIMYTNE